MKRLLLVLLISGSFSILSQAEVTCLDNFNTSWNDAWNHFDLDKYECLVDPFSAPFNCEQDALDNLNSLQNNAINNFDSCCTADPNC